MVAFSALPSDGDISGIATALDHWLVIDGLLPDLGGMPVSDLPERFGNWS